MRYHQLVNKTVVLLLCGGLYLPRVRNVINNNFAVNLLSTLSVVPAISAALFSISLFIPMLTTEMALMEWMLALASSISCLSTTFKLYFCYWNRARIDRIFDVWDESSEEDLHADLRKEILLKTKKTADRWTVAFGSALLGSAALYASWPYFTRRLEHKTVIPYTNDSPGFEIMVTFELVAQCYLCLFVHSYNCFVMQNVAFEQAMCKYLQLSLAMIIGALNVSERGEIEETGAPAAKGKDLPANTSNRYREACAEGERKIRIWIRQHQNLLRFHSELQSVFHIPLCVEFSGLILQICIVVFMIVGNSLSPIMVFICIAYCVNIYTIFYVTCHYGDGVQQLSGGLHESAFGGSWYIYPRTFRVVFYFIVMRCRKPMSLVAFAIYPLNSGSFARIFRQAYSFLMFLVQVTRRSRT